MASFDLSQLKSKKMSKRDINMILCAVAFLALVATYLLGFSSMKEKTAETQQKLEERTAYLTELQGYFDNLDSYKRGTAAAKTSIDANLDRLPVGFQNEDFLLSMMRVDEALGTKMSSISFNSVDHIADFNTFIGDSYKTVQGFRASASCAITMTYEQFKTYIDYLYADDYDYTYIDNVSVTYNAESRKLSTTFNISKFFIQYEDCQYIGEKGYDVAFGKGNPFGSK